MQTSTPRPALTAAAAFSVWLRRRRHPEFGTKSSHDLALSQAFMRGRQALDVEQQRVLNRLVDRYVAMIAEPYLGEVRALAWRLGLTLADLDRMRDRVDFGDGVESYANVALVTLVALARLGHSGAASAWDEQVRIVTGLVDAQVRRLENVATWVAA